MGHIDDHSEHWAGQVAHHLSGVAVVAVGFHAVLVLNPIISSSEDLHTSFNGFVRQSHQLLLKNIGQSINIDKRTIITNPYVVRQAGVIRLLFHILGQETPILHHDVRQ
jgi:hypothetical protein